MHAPAADRLAPDRLVARLASRRGAVIPVGRLPKLWGLDPDAAAVALAELLEAGRVEVWGDAPGAPCAILSATEAAARGLELVSPEWEGTDVETRSGARRFWWRPVSAEAPERSIGWTVTDLEPDDEQDLIDLPDRGPSPQELAAFREWAEQWFLDPARKPTDQPPWFVRRAFGDVVLGSRIIWPPAPLLEGETCPGCDGLDLPSNVYCLACSDRAELERRRAEVERSTLAGGVGAATAGKAPEPSKPRRPESPGRKRRVRPKTRQATRRY
jgi:hypothetical protein